MLFRSPADLLHGHVGSIDACARALLAAEAMLAKGTLERPLAERYAGWDAPEAKAILAGERTLDQVADRAIAEKLDPKPRSGRQEYLEGLVLRSV